MGLIGLALSGCIAALPPIATMPFVMVQSGSTTIPSCRPSLTPAVEESISAVGSGDRVENHFAASSPWNPACQAGMRKESDMYVFYDLQSLVGTLGKEFWVSVKGVTLSRDHIPPIAAICATANAGGIYHILFPTPLLGRARCSAHSTDLIRRIWDNDVEY